MSASLLVELRTEELPPKSLMRLGLAFREALQKSLAEAGFIDVTQEGEWFATPRRLALRFAGCRATQPDRVLEKKGPAVASGIDAAGNPTKALEGFLRSAGVPFAALERVHDGKAEYFVARQQKVGEPLAAHLPAMVEAALKKLPVAKLMRWGDGDAQFVRPVHGLIMLHGANVVPGRVLGIDSGATTQGHRFMSAGEIVIDDADRYGDALLTQGRVVAGFDARRRMIRQQLDAAAAALNLAWLEDDALLDEVTALVEHPSVYAAQFEPEFLAVPPECLILTMKANQKYFPLMDRGRLSNRFLVVSNMQVADPANIVGGNARVVRPRLADAKFFFETDKKTPLAARVEKLARVVYHNQLGTQGERVQRLMKLAGSIARMLGADVAHATRGALLAKADLVSDMVGEFPELQGIMGRYYALADGEPEDVADAVAAHYHPRGAGDSLPLGNVACAVALADRLDALAGFFGIGQVPTGDKDPFALRRAALGVLRILMETPLPLDLATLIDEAAAGYPGGTVGDAAKVACADFLRERLRHLLREQGNDAAQVDAVLALAPTRIDQVPARLAAVRAFVALPEAEALAAANKRIVNILKKSAGAADGVDPALFAEGAERELFHALIELAPEVDSRLAAEDYEGALRALAGLRGAVDAFFDGVMVNTEEPLLRANRLALLARLATLMNRVADISRLQGRLAAAGAGHAENDEEGSEARRFPAVPSPPSVAKSLSMKLVILDRDGVINHDSDHYIKSPEEWVPIAGSLEAIARLCRDGWHVVVATNQSGVGRGLFDMDTLNAIHEKMTRAVAQMGGRIDAIFFCPHTATDGCDCRKPATGLFREIAARFNADLAQTPAIGDSLRDIQAAIAAGAQPMLVLTGKGKKTAKDPALPDDVPQSADLAAAVDRILAEAAR